MLEHERVAIAVGERSALPVIVAVHSTVLGQAVGGCRLWRYGDWREALDDALRLSEAMTLKCALAGLPLGGGKSVIALAPDSDLTARPAAGGDARPRRRRRRVRWDLRRGRGRGHDRRGHADRARADPVRVLPSRVAGRRRRAVGADRRRGTRGDRRDARASVRVCGRLGPTDRGDRPRAGRLARRPPARRGRRRARGERHRRLQAPAGRRARSSLDGPRHGAARRRRSARARSARGDPHPGLGGGAQVRRDRRSGEQPTRRRRRRGRSATIAASCGRPTSS